jgi:predicted small secreted protein
MKKILVIAACVAALAFLATSCYQSVVTPLGDDLASFTKKVDQTTEYVGVKNTANGVVLVEPIYEVVYYKMDYIIAAKANDYAIFERTGERVFGNLHINKVEYAKTYFLFGTTGGQKYFFLPHNELCGPASEFVYHPAALLLFAKDMSGKWGVLNPESGEVVLEPKYSDLVYAIDEKGNGAFYTGSKTLKRISETGEKNVTKANANALFKEATDNKTPWPKTGVGVVKVKTLR